VLFDGRQLAGEGAIDERWGDAVEPGEQTFGKAEMMLAMTAAQGGDDLSRDLLRLVAGALEGAVEGLDGVAVERRIDRAGGDVDDGDQRIGQFTAQAWEKPRRPALAAE
jgi:hypothetical protein